MTAIIAERVPAAHIRRDHIGATVTIQPPCPHAPEQLTITGVLRWITHTSDAVILAVEEGGDDGDGAVEWDMPLGAPVIVQAPAARAEQ